jgi:hypothetical protein
MSKIKFKDIIDSIEFCAGGKVNFLFDSETINETLLLLIKKELRKNYNIIENIDIEDLNVYNIKEKTVIFLNYTNTNLFKTKFRTLLGNENVIIIVMRNLYFTTNTSLLPHSVIFTGEISYTSSLIFLLKNKKLKIMKSRYVKEHIPIMNQTVDINFLIRKIKLQTLNEK